MEINLEKVNSKKERNHLNLDSKFVLIILYQCLDKITLSDCY